MDNRFLTAIAFAVVHATAFAVSPAAWDEACYEGVGANVASMVGNGGRDCGLVRIRAPEEDFSSVIGCAKEAVAQGVAVRFGYEGYGDDSDFCAIAAVTPDGEVISVWIDQDVQGGATRDGSQRAVNIRRCGQIEFKQGTIYPRSFFAMQGCRAAPDLEAQWGQ